MCPDNRDVFFMRMALIEARKGMGRTAPNPCVGAVVVKDGNVIGRGYHQKAGTPHAEVHALRHAGMEADGATLYVTLEPCCHEGKTPPCCHAVVGSGIKRVVIGMLDPNPLVNGGGRRYLLDQGLKVTTGILAEECCSINEPFLKFISTGCPLVILKAGASLDGRLNYQKDISGWITGPQTLEKVHQLRNRFDAILVGSRTIGIDNPSLTTRLTDEEGRDPIRIILDSNLSIAPSATVLNLKSAAPTWIFCSASIDSLKLKKLEEIEGVEVFPVSSDASGYLDLDAVMEVLGKNNVSSVLVEGGAAVHASFLEKQLVDQVILFYAPLFAGSSGVSLAAGLNIADRDDAIRLVDVRYTRMGHDIMVEGNVTYPRKTV